MNLFFYILLETVSKIQFRVSFSNIFIPPRAQLFAFLFAVVSDDEALDSEDEKMIGRLGFVAATSSMDHESTSSSKNQTSNDKSKMSNVCPQADITKVTPGNCFFIFPT